MTKTLCAMKPQSNVPKGSLSAKTREGQLRVYSWTCTKSTKASKKKEVGVKHVPGPESIKQICNSTGRVITFLSSSLISFHLVQFWKGQVSRLAIGVRMVDARGKKGQMEDITPFPGLL